MSTQYLHRVLIICPSSRRTAMVNFWNANIDPGQGAATWSVPLNATGNPADPITHYVISGAFVPADLTRLVTRLCTLATTAGTSITPPANWQTMTRAEQLDWLRDTLPSIRQATGIAVVRDDNDGEWSNADATLEALGLKRIQAVLS
jgi:hypothetical protein